MKSPNRLAFVAFLVIWPFLGPPRLEAAEPMRATGTIKAVDPKGRTLTLRVGSGVAAKDAELEVSRKATVTHDGKAATLESLMPGQAVVVEYNADLGVATKIEASGVGDAATLPPKLAKLTELNKDGMDFGPWASGDGLTIYWTEHDPGQPPWILTASRPDPESFFENTKKLFPGLNPTVTDNGLVLVFHDQKGDLHLTTRAAVDRPFRRPSVIVELESQPFCRRPCLSSDGLSLYFDRSLGKDRGTEFCFTTRRSPTSPWEAPKPLPIDRRNAPLANLTSCYVLGGGSAMLCADFRKFDGAGSNFMVWTRSRPGGAFDKFEYLQTGDIPAFGTYPRYVEATRELFFNSDRAVSDKMDDKEKGAELFVVRNFTLPVSGETPTSKSDHAPRPK